MPSHFMINGVKHLGVFDSARKDFLEYLHGPQDCFATDFVL